MANDGSLSLLIPARDISSCKTRALYKWIHIAKWARSSTWYLERIPLCYAIILPVMQDYPWSWGTMAFLQLCRMPLVAVSVLQTLVGDLSVCFHQRPRPGVLPFCSPHCPEGEKEPVPSEILKYHSYPGRDIDRNISSTLSAPLLSPNTTTCLRKQFV